MPFMADHATSMPGPAVDTRVYPATPGFGAGPKLTGTRKAGPKLRKRKVGLKLRKRG